MVDRLRADIEFRIITSDRDLSDRRPYTTVQQDKWTMLDGIPVWYASPSTQKIRALCALISATPHEILYLNSYFDSPFTIGPLIGRRLGWLPHRPIVLAPRGELSDGALQARAASRAKKLAYSAIASLGRLDADLTWQASSEHEAAEIVRFRRVPPSTVIVAPDLASLESEGEPRWVDRSAGQPLRICFVSRISPKKNLDFALEVLADVRVPVVFNIYGPREDLVYWQKCERLMRKITPPVSAFYRGELTHDAIVTTFAAHDLLFLPTRGENYGHVIIESLRAGTPALISNTTPWRGLEAQKVGWDLPLDPNAFVTAIEQAFGMTAEFPQWRRHAREFGYRRSHDPAVTEANRRLFLTLASK
jgi:glycosyltransferase involved in cell wall biosynthesis